MSKQYVLVDADALTKIEARLLTIQETLAAVKMQPAPEWVSVDQYAETVGRSVQTVRAWIRQGRVETKQMGNKRMVRA
ncbi:MAG: hypothetical protein ABJH45_24810 [Paracoccaceae bacterium]|uniref:hypothetical protein n=1 Tax=Rhodobacterales TaxID=204455 RepID=UPI003296B5FE